MWNASSITACPNNNTLRAACTRFTHNTGCRRVGGGTAAANAQAAAAAALHAASVESGQKILAQTHAGPGLPVSTASLPPAAAPKQVRRRLMHLTRVLDRNDK